MHLSTPTKDLLRSLDALSGNTLARRDDLGTLLELAMDGFREETLQELSFQAKFVFKAQGILKRAQSPDESYANISRELTGAVERVTALIGSLLADAPDETRTHFEMHYMKLTSEALENLFALCHDLSWYKNRLIDRAGRHHP